MIHMILNSCHCIYLHCFYQHLLNDSVPQCATARTLVQKVMVLLAERLDCPWTLARLMKSPQGLSMLGLSDSVSLLIFNVMFSSLW